MCFSRRLVLPIVAVGIFRSVDGYVAEGNSCAVCNKYLDVRAESASERLAVVNNVVRLDS